MINIETKKFPFWILVALAAPLLVLLGCSLWFYQAEETAARQRAEQQLAAIAHLKADQIVAWRNERLGAAAMLMENRFFLKSVARFLTDPEGMDAPELNKHLRTLQARYHYANVLIVDPEGRVRLSLAGDPAEHDGFAVALTEALRDQKPACTDLHIQTNSPSPHFSVVSPIFIEGQHRQPLFDRHA